MWICSRRQRTRDCLAAAAVVAAVLQVAAVLIVTATMDIAHLGMGMHAVVEVGSVITETVHARPSCLAEPSATRTETAKLAIA
jgi:hypothetical protein